MRWPVLLLIALAASGICIPALAGSAGPDTPGLTISASPGEARIGDTIVLNGTVTGINTIAVYLYVTGENLDPRGVSLENLNIAAGRGLFTTAPVFMKNGTWIYTWDTSIITGNLEPGNYSVYVVASPHDRLRSIPQETAVTDIRIIPNDEPDAETPLSPLGTIGALAGGMLLFGVAGLRRR